MRRRRTAAAVGVELSGCNGVPVDEPTPTNASATTPAATATAALDVGGKQQASPDSFLVVRPVGNQSVVESADDNATVAFENLTTTRRESFETALESGDRSAADGWSFYDNSGPAYVRYNGTRYSVTVATH